jgi:tRNA threonylcarbamoyladenosine biosynthesis protein TsaE
MIEVADELAMRTLGGQLATQWKAGEVVRLIGPLGAGKTTLVRGVLEGLGYDGPVRSPTFNLIQVYATVLPVLHADLYRLKSAAGLGLEDFESTHLLLVEWPDRMDDLFPPETTWNIDIEIVEQGRRVTVSPPSRYSP